MNNPMRTTLRIIVLAVIVVTGLADVLFILGAVSSFFGFATGNVRALLGVAVFCALLGTGSLVLKACFVLLNTKLARPSPDRTQGASPVILSKRI